MSIKGYEIPNYAAARGITLYQALKELNCMAHQQRMRRAGIRYKVLHRPIADGKQLAYEAKPV